jgi:hypothetical protein
VFKVEKLNIGCRKAWYNKEKWVGRFSFNPIVRNSCKIDGSSPGDELANLGSIG